MAGAKTLVERCSGLSDCREKAGKPVPEPSLLPTPCLLLGHSLANPTGRPRTREPTDAASWGLRTGWRRDSANQGGHPAYSSYVEREPLTGVDLYVTFCKMHTYILRQISS